MVLLEPRIVLLAGFLVMDKTPPNICPHRDFNQESPT